jgi:glycosyltransferase involved in cell wall biosynthesis
MRPPPHVVMVSWRDPAHPRAGGAERYTAQVTAALVASGMRVTWLAPAFAGSPPHGRVDGVSIVRTRRGLLHVPAAVAYLRRHRASIDLVIDQVNGYPMFTYLAFARPRVLLIHQLAREIWFLHAPWPLAALAWLAEPLLLRPYRGTTAVTVSPSTKDDLERWGFADVRVVPNAVTGAAPPRERERPWPPRFVAVGRLVPSKRFDHLLDAFDLVRATRPGASLTLIGSGEGRHAAMLAARIAATPGASLEHRASEARKWSLLAEATALVATSTREGWGIVVSEAHCAGTPTVAYDVPGLRDSTRDGVDGLLCRPTPADAARAMVRLASDDVLWRRCRAGALAGAAERTPARQAAAILAVVEEALAAPARAAA